MRILLLSLLVTNGVLPANGHLPEKARTPMLPASWMTGGWSGNWPRYGAGRKLVRTHGWQHHRTGTHSLT